MKKVKKIIYLINLWNKFLNILPVGLNKKRAPLKPNNNYIVVKYQCDMPVNTF